MVTERSAVVWIGGEVGIRRAGTGGRSRNKYLGIMEMSIVLLGVMVPLLHT